MAERWFKAWVIPDGHWLRSDTRYIGAWYDLIGMAEWQDGRTVRRGTMIETKRGMVYASVNELAARWGWTWRTTKRFLTMLENDGMVQMKTQNREQNCFLCNYAKYQDMVSNREQNKEQSREQNREQNRRQNKSQFLPNKEELKEYTEGENRTKSPRAQRFVPPTLAEVLQFISEERLRVDGRRFYDYYESNGWKVGKNAMKDWKAAARNWSRKETQEQAPNPKRFDNFDQRGAGSLMDQFIAQEEARYG